MTINVTTKEEKKTEKTKICDAVRFRMDRFDSIWFYRTWCVRRCRSHPKSCAQRERKENFHCERAREHMPNTSQRHNIALNHRSIYARFCFNFYCINNRYLAVAHIYRERVRVYDRLYAFLMSDQRVSEPEWLCRTSNNMSLCRRRPKSNDTPKK